MSESSDKLRGVRELPLFPLPLVLFPGVPLPLHIFEPRYRQMLADVKARDQLFGLSFFDATESSAEAPAIGHVGCVAEVTEVQPLSDGRSNILTMGLIRYRLEAYVEHNDPYLVGRVRFFEDDEEEAGILDERADEVSKLFLRIARAVRIINDERASLPDLPPTDPERLSFLVAAAMELDTGIKLELLELRSTAERLKRLRDLLARAVPGYEERARIHDIAKGNGHGGKHIDLE
ncbi:MAG TPA: LON peptidase substrate-binding domain-containing protein [Pyrinomonadaceae bacterium]|nr:LON peptidase substrate-binding domain-containing protein [Pyrinomonadaceae bacterium]